MVVAVRGQRVGVLVLSATLALASAPAATVGAQADVEPDCRQADDGSGDIVCELPEECADGANDSLCEPPDECEQVDELTFRCPQPDRGTANDSDAMTRRSANGTVTAGPPASCQPQNGTLVCTLAEECRTANASPACDPPSHCEQVGEHRYRCDPPTGGHAPPDRDRNRTDRQRPGCQPGPENGTVVCEPPAECRNATDQACSPPPGCEPRGDGTYLCRTDAEPAKDAADRGPDCRPGDEPGTVVCQPPEACEGRIGETEACTPPETCQRRSDGAFVCEIPDRGQSPRPGGNASVDAPEGEVSSEGSLFGQDGQARQEARRQVAKALEQAAQDFRERLDSLRGDYEQTLDELRSEYQQGKDQLREDYRDCRSSIPANVSGDERTQRMQDCLEEARQGLQELKSRLEARHDELVAQFKDKIEQARSEACSSAEQAALDAVAEHGVFSANPADLMPEGALELCPSFADLDDGGVSK